MRELALLLRLAFRNAWRNPRRSLFTLVSLLVGVGLFIVARSFVDGIDATLVAIEIDHESAHVRVTPAGYRAEEDYQPLDKPLAEAEALAGALVAGFPGTRTTTRISFAAEVGDGRRALRCRGLVVDPAAYGAVFDVGPLVPRPGEATLWAGVDLARAFGWRPGDRVFLKARTARGTLNALDDVRFGGAVSTGHPLVDNFTVLVPPEVGATLLDVPPGFATELMVRLPEAEAADAAVALVAARAPAVETETWADRTRDFRELNALRRRGFDVVVAFILLIAAAGVANTALMSAFERTPEIGMMLALGLSRARVVGLLLTESVLIAAVGAALGAGVGGAIAGWFARRGLAFPEMAAAEDLMPVPPLLYFDLRADTVGTAVALGVGVALLAALYPAVRAARLSPIEALREGGA